MRRFLLRILNVIRPDGAERELGSEVEAHLAMLEDEHRRRGLSPEDARLAARRAMGSIALAKDLHRDARSFVWLDDARQDLRFGARILARSPGFAATAILTMALSVGATTALFSLAYGVLMRPLPWPEPDRLVRLQETRGGRAPRIPWTISNGAYLAWRDDPSTIEEIGGWFRSRPMTVRSGGEPERLLVGSVTPSLFRVLRARVHAGRLFVDSDATAGQSNVVMLGYGLWQRRFGGQSGIVGQSIRIDGQSYTVVGVMPAEFEFPNADTQAWIPQGISPVRPRRDVVSLMIFSAMARLKPGVTVPQAETEATSRARRAPDPGPAGVALFGGSGPPAVAALGARDVLTVEVRPALLILLAAVGLLFLASTVSLIVLQLSRIARRSRETSLRTALGAGAGRLARQWLTESALLGVIGGTAGLLLAALLHQLLPLRCQRDSLASATCVSTGKWPFSQPPGRYRQALRAVWRRPSAGESCDWRNRYPLAAQGRRPLL